MKFLILNFLLTLIFFLNPFTLFSKENKTTNFTSNFLVARQNLYDNNLSQATKYFELVLSQDLENERILKQSFVSNYQNGNLEKAIKLANKIEEKDLSFALASEPIIGTLILENDWRAVLAIISKIERDQSNLIFSKGLKTLSYLALDEPENSLNELNNLKDSLSILKIDELPYLKLFIGNIFELSNKTKDAEKIYIEISKDKKTPSLIKVSLVNALLRIGKEELALNIVEREFSDSFYNELIKEKLKNEKKTDTNVLSVHRTVSEFIIFSSLYSHDNYQSSLLLPRAHLSLLINPDNPISNYILAEKFYRFKNYETSKKYIKRISSNFMWAQPVFFVEYDILKSTKSDEFILEFLKNKLVSKRDTFIRKSEILELIGDIYRNSKNYEKSIIFYKKSIESNVSSDIFRKLGICYERTNQDKLAEKYFKLALKLDPNDAFTLNYLGYWWADENRNLDQAIELIIKAVSLEPSSGYFADSLGWVFFKMGEYDKAVEWLEKAIQLTPTDPIIADHLGDAYWKTGRFIEAKYKWKHALSLGISDENITKINNKLKK